MHTKLFTSDVEDVAEELIMLQKNDAQHAVTATPQK
jgi:hypothetical protein